MSSGKESPERSSSKGPARRSLSALADECQYLLYSLTESSSLGNERGVKLYNKIYNSLRRFDIWVADMTQSQNGRSRHPLDWRLQRASLMEAAVRAALRQIKSAGDPGA